MLHSTSYSSGYTSAIQRFLYCNPLTKEDIRKSGGVDGAYGSGTANAVLTFQDDVKSSWGWTEDMISSDGEVGPQTWSAIATALTYQYSEDDNVYANFREEGLNVIKYHYNPDTKKDVLSYYNTYGGIGKEFHTL